MQDRTHNNDNAKFRAIIDNALSEMVELGIKNSTDAAMLMAIQSIVRIHDTAKLTELAEFLADSIPMSE
ncbi:hypothetical protein GCM10023115_19280 [Pontixanthobacter gangjinensis]|uniref:Uncharacterized protein n=1 Tax=Pontixanthobacter gangjinensis TaxID=1028742 RepID=A0A6I4SQP7_9SPHN|nr:hypothetical protein [Pontixanthobacter gangjinensis]MXO57177.1 hypothetical protein [Pontixanthobacter gangjinensis]